MGREIERKYLVRSGAWRQRAQSAEPYQQGYQLADEGRSVRVGRRKAFLTIKGKSPAERAERKTRTQCSGGLRMIRPETARPTTM